MGSAMEEARAMFAEAGVAFPPIPARLALSFRRIEDWCYATRDVDPLEMYMGRRYPLEALTGAASEYVAVSHAGHGINSYALNFDLVYGWVALFVQTGWGGVYNDDAAAAEQIASQFEQCAVVIDEVEQLPARPDTATGMLVVVQSDFRDLNVCRWLPRPIAEDGASEWLSAGAVAEGTALAAAAMWLRERRLDPAGLA